MISMSQAYSIRQLKKQGETVAEIARKVGVCRNTVYNCLAEDDLSPKMPAIKKRTKILDPYRPLIISWLEGDRSEWRKQRHTAHRIWVRLTTEEGVKVGESTVRAYVRTLREELGHSDADDYLDQRWVPGEAQADFGEADFSVRGVKVRLSYFVLTFPYSNIGIAQVFPGENAECVCQALRNIFEFIGGVPGRIVFDNATGVGRRVCEGVRTTELFGAFAAHYNFAFSFCSPNAGHEKGSVEAKVRYLRSNLFVPVPHMTDPAKYNAKLPSMCMELSKEHYLKGEPEEQLFVEDKFAMAGLPQKPFDIVRYERPKADKKGKVKLDGQHSYSSDPSLAGRELIAAMRATTVTLYTAAGEFVCEHPRAYGKAPTDTSDPASQLAVRPPQVTSERASLGIDDAGVSAEGTGTSVVSVSGKVKYDLPDPIAELQDAVGLTRGTIKAILEGCSRLDEFEIDPATFLAQVGDKINRVKNDLIAQGIKYVRLPEDEWYTMRDLELDDYTAYLGQNAWKPDMTSKSLYNYVVYDSAGVERSFAEALDKQEEVLVFAKLPSAFKIDTPLGSYNPDWAYVEEADGERRVYFVTETKGGKNGEPALRDAEKIKIGCAKKHFEALDLGNDFHYNVRTTYQYEAVKA